MLELAKFLPLTNKIINNVKTIDLKYLIKSKSSIVYLKEPLVNEKLLKNLNKLLNRKRHYIIYIESKQNIEIKEAIKQNKNKDMVSFIYDFDNLTKLEKFSVHDYIRVDANKDIKVWEKAFSMSRNNYAQYIIANIPKLEDIESIPNNFTVVFDNETN